MDYPAIKRYLEGHSESGEEQQIRDWLRNPANETAVKQVLGEIWTNSSIDLQGTEPDIEQLLKRVHYRLDQQVDVKPAIHHKIYLYFSRAAAILLLPLILLSAYLLLQPQYDHYADGSEIREIYTKPGTRTQIELSDGTKVWLNDGTILRYPENFTGENREVFVDGEAYFEVESNPDNPFIVESPYLKTVVTGTHFNLNAYADDQFFEATLLEGKIHLESGKQQIDLLQGEQIQYDALQNQIIRKKINTDYSVAWVNGQLMIYNERLEYAIKKLSRWYNVDIVITDEKIKDYEITFTLEDEKLEQSLDLISHALSIDYRIKNEDKLNQTKNTVYLMAK